MLSDTFRMSGFTEKLDIPYVTEISDYNTLKFEFENFIKSKVKESKTIIVNWDNITRLEFTIIKN